jgi:hypothetical protein
MNHETDHGHVLIKVVLILNCDEIACMYDLTEMNGRSVDGEACEEGHLSDFDEP